MCSCTSCKATDAMAGWKDDGAGNTVPDLEHGGFERWPRGEPAGKRSSDAAYAAHAKHCGSDGMPKPWRYVSRPPQFSTAGLTMPITPAPQWVRDWINRDSVKAPPIPERPTLSIVPATPKPAALADDLADFIRRRMAA